MKEEEQDKINAYLSENGKIVIDLMMRVASLEKILVEKSVCTEEEVQEEVQKTYAVLAEKAKENEILNADNT